MTKTAQVLSSLNENFFDFFDFAVKKFCGSSVDLDPEANLQSGLPGPPPQAAVKIRFTPSITRVSGVAQGIEAEISRVTYGNTEELQRKARPRLAGMRPKTKYQSKHRLQPRMLTAIRGPKGRA
jgi:hypothetical protein